MAYEYEDEKLDAQMRPVEEIILAVHGATSSEGQGNQQKSEALTSVPDLAASLPGPEDSSPATSPDDGWHESAAHTPILQPLGACGLVSADGRYACIKDIGHEGPHGSDPASSSGESHEKVGRRVSPDGSAQTADAHGSPEASPATSPRPGEQTDSAGYCGRHGLFVGRMCSKCAEAEASVPAKKRDYRTSEEEMRDWNAHIEETWLAEDDSPAKRLT